ncbi:MAG: hypothetical protein EOO53_20710 [Gammaproteobacteria bacterium]|nr:MAG: hypothetical protein EOO53_20710 [Gammaproteobacteria bacterium]
MNQNERWYIVFTKQQCERKVVFALTNKGYQCFCPYQNNSTLWKAQEKPLHTPLFSSHVFVRCTPDQFYDIKKVPGVINFMYRFNQLAVVTNEDMVTITHTISNYRNVKVLKSGFDANLPTANPDSQVFNLQSLGMMLVAENKNQVVNEPVTAELPQRNFNRLSYRFRLAWR